MVYSRDPKRGFKVPHSWSSDSCVLIIDTIGDIDQTLRLTDIAFTATLIEALCIGRPDRPDLGGRGTAGPDDKLSVILGGLPKKGLRLPGHGNNISDGTEEVDFYERRLLRIAKTT